MIQKFIIVFKMLCYVITNVLGLNHFERASVHHNDFSVFNSFWFMFMFYTTVGLGDVYPKLWISKLPILGLGLFGKTVKCQFMRSLKRNEYLHLIFSRCDINQ